MVKMLSNRPAYIEKEIISLATVQAVLGTAFRITGVGSPQEASELALLLRAGALAAPMKFVEERTVGPSLGKENVELGVRSIIIGLCFQLLLSCSFIIAGSDLLQILLFLQMLS